MNNLTQSILNAIKQHRVIAILRGLTPHEAPAIGLSLMEAGMMLLEVPLNRPGALDAIQALQDALGERLLIGAGTVVKPGQVEAACKAGARYLLSPNVDLSILAEAKQCGVPLIPGCFTPSEAFAALKVGAPALKLFPYSILGARGVSDLRAVLDPVPLIAVGGVSVTNLAETLRVADAVGIGGQLYSPGRSAEEVGRHAREFLTALSAITPTIPRV